MKILFAVRKGEEDWKEQLITEVEARIPAASEWAKANGFDRLRIAEIDDKIPDFAGTISTGRSSQPPCSLAGAAQCSPAS